MKCAGLFAATAVIAGVMGLGAPHSIAGELPAEVKERGKLIVGTYCDYAPFGFIGEDQKPQGIEVDLAKKLAEYAFGSEDAIDLQCVKSAERIAYLQTRKVDFLISALGITPTRAEVIDFSKPYFASTTVFLAQKGNEFTTFDDLTGKTLLLSSGTPWIPWLQKCEPEIEIAQYDSITNQLAALQAGRGVALLNDSTLLYPVAARNDAFVITGPDVKEQGYSWAMGVRKGNDQMREWIDEQIDRLSEEDIFWEVIQRWEKNPATLEGLERVIRRPGIAPDYSTYQASTTAEPSCPE
jgi:polar amino acid transport system substrate-binding protein